MPFLPKQGGVGREKLLDKNGSRNPIFLTKLDEKKLRLFRITPTVQFDMSKQK